MNPENPYQPQPGATPPAGQQPPFQGQPTSAPLPPQPQQPAATAPNPYYQQPQPIVTPNPLSQPPQPVVSPLPTPAPLGGAQSPLPSGASAEQYSVDYLNQIAPKQQKTVNRFAIFGLSGAVIMAVVAVVIIMANAGGPDFSAQAKSLQARINTLQTVADSQQSHLKENVISEANSSLSSALTSTSTDLTTIMKAKGLKTSSGSSATISKTEKAYAASLQKKLDDAYQRGTLDRTYTTQMTYELTLLRSKLTRLKHTANSKSITAFCDTATTNIDAIIKTYNNFSATK
jgi:hypothetical protein